MDCEKARKLWNDVIDGSEGSAPLEEMNAHFESCLECKKYKKQMADLLGVLDDLRSESEEGPVQSRPTTQLRRAIGFWMKIAAGIMIVLGTTIFLATQHQNHKPTDMPVIVSRSVDEVPQTSIVGLKQESARTLLAVQCKTDHPRVHLFVLYPLARATSVEKKIN
jgi:predicted anti-sigma-YlaC factor YlaD